MEGLISVRLRDSGQIFLFNPDKFSLKEGDYVIVEHDRGLDYGQVVHSNGGCPRDAKAKEPPKKIARTATAEDLKQIEENRSKAKDAYSICAKKIEEHRLAMKMVQAEYS